MAGATSWFSLRRRTPDRYARERVTRLLIPFIIGAIVLTLRHRTDVKRQDVVAQMMRDPAKAMELKDVKPGQGL